MEAVMEKKKKAFKMPHGYVVIFAILIFVSVMTYVIPAGEYAREVNAAGQEVVVPGSFQYIEKTPVPFWEIPNYIMESFTKQADIIFGVLIVGAGLEVLLSTGMFHAFCNRLSKACSGKEKWFIPLFVLLFASIGITQSTNKFIGFTPLGVMLAATLGYDAIMGVSIVMLGIGIGFSSGIFASTTAVAQGLVGLPAYSGISMRILAFVVLYLLTVGYLIRYGEKCKKDPTKSAVYGVPDIKRFDVNDGYQGGKTPLSGTGSFPLFLCSPHLRLPEVRMDPHPERHCIHVDGNPERPGLWLYSQQNRI